MKFLHQDVGTEISWVQLQAACFQENKQNVQFLLDADTDVNHFSSAVYTPLHIAVTKSNIDLVTLLLDKDVNVNSVTIDGKTPLHIATDKNDETIIQKLLAHNADPRLKDVPGNTSLHLAVRLKQETRSEHVKAGVSYMSPFPTSYHTCSVHTVRAIIDHGADVNVVNNRGQTALWFACVNGQESFVGILLDTGADPNIADKHRESCLHAAIHGHCNTETIQKLIDRGAHVNAVNNDGATPLLLVCSAAQAESVELFLTLGADPNIADVDGDTSILNAIEGYCSVTTMQYLIDNGANVNATNNKGLTALLKACSYRQMDVVKVLLEAGADPTIVDDVHYSSLHAAVDGRCSKDTLQALVDHGAHIDAERKDGTNALLRACKTGQSESVRFLLEAGADVNIAKPNGNTCLHEAVCGRCSKEILQKIIEQGINVNAVNKEKMSALQLACESAQAESIKLLLQKGSDTNISDARGNTSLHAAVYGCCTNDTLQEVIAHRVHLDARNTYCETALWLACSYRQQGSIKILLESGSNPNIADNNGDTCLHAAVRGGCSKKIVHMIIEHCSDVNATNQENITPLAIACLNKDERAINVLLNARANPNIADYTFGDTCLHKAVTGDCSIEVLQTIIDHGADVNATNTRNETALARACAYKNESAIKVLLNARADPNIADDTYGDTCLHKIVTGDCSIEVLQAIIDHGANVNATNAIDETALARACAYKNEGAINVLLNARADPNIADETYGDTCLHTVVSGNCSIEVLQAIIDHGANVNATNAIDETALARACAYKNEGAINVLLNARADPNIADETHGDTCLHKVVTGNCSIEVLQAIIYHGANVNATNTRNETALTLACVYKNEGAINILLNAKADPNFADYTCGDTCLHKAVTQECSKEVLVAIIGHGVDVNAANKENETALTIACIIKNEGAINVLLNARADPNIADADGDTCLHYAVTQECRNEVLQAIIDHGVDVNAADKRNETALTIACANRNEDAINVLLNASAAPNIAEADG